MQSLNVVKNNNKSNYEMEGNLFDSLKEERDLGFIISSDLKVAKQCIQVVNTANRVLGMIYRTFTYRTSEVLLPLYKSLVRPHLEFCIQAWPPFLSKDIDCFGKGSE